MGVEDGKILNGKNILLTRSESQSSRMKDLLNDLGANVLEFPTISIQPIEDKSELDEKISNIIEYSWIIFTSVNSVQIFFHRLFEVGLDARSLSNASVAVIGEATFNATCCFGIIPDLMPPVNTSKGLIDAFNDYGIELSGEKILIPSSKIARNYVLESLDKMGAKVDKVTVYDTIPVEYTSDEVSEMFFNDIDFVVFTSSSTVVNLKKILVDNNLESKIHNIKTASIGPMTDETVLEQGFNLTVTAETHNVEGVVDAIVNYYSNN